MFVKFSKTVLHVKCDSPVIFLPHSQPIAKLTHPAVVMAWGEYIDVNDAELDL